MAVLKPYRGNYYLWDYLPSTPAAVIFVVLFAGATGFVGWQMAKTRTWFSIPFVLGGLFQFLGYVARAYARDKTDQLGPFVMQSVLILVAPALFAASIYMTLGRLMRSIHGERHSLIPVNWLTKAFVLGDVLSFLVQSTGAGLMAVKNFDPKKAENIILVGLIVQIVMFGLFAMTAAIFHVRMRRWPSAASMDAGWVRIMMMLYATSALILVRSVFRVVEYIMGKEGYLLTHEWTLYVFDAALMFGTMVVYGVVYPGHLSRGELRKPRAWDVVDSGPGEDEVRPGGK
ncbi:RTA1 like domain protein [Metarhizium robertsii]|uniref:RTA1 like protein n=2 Tax=Metarhizium robertsii TaxID=568076 RepID=E9ERI1_METRA|nr:RTA1 like protein [Metarhizium robertsii ARSEF 23]EFZ01348.1 RTA1 like protein [Metarhizium robertsii ARSEF 23]EXU99549.1 RTA1 like domain protein [Metarhizium robertsii]